MPQDFSGQNLRGRSFKGQNLEGANFSYADIRGANFTNANLTGANFTNAKAGLQKRWATFLTILSWALVGTSGFFFGFTGIFIAQLIFANEGNLIQSTIAAWTVMVILIIFFFVTIRQGIQAGLGTIAAAFALVFALAVAVALNGGGAFGGFGQLTLALALALPGAFAGAVAEAFARAVSRAGAGVVAGGGVVAAVAAVALFVYGGALEKTVASVNLGTAAAAAAAAAITLVLSNTYIGYSALKESSKQTLLRNIAIAFAAFKGTNFHNANLTDANFTEATLKNTDFRKATLTRTYFYKTKKLDFARPGQNYLQNAQVRLLLVSGLVENKNFDHQDMRGVNLQGANLESTSFIDTDFYQANLSGANLARSILVRSNFERADLRGACLTGSCIQDWTISRGTKLDAIVCDYVYLKWDDVKKDKRDQMPPRGKFKEGGFVTFVKYILDTVELYHEKDINPRLALTVLQKMARDYDEPLNVVALGKRGEKVFIQIKVSEKILQDQFKKDYYSRYDEDLKLWSGNIHQLPPAVNSFIEKRISEIVSERTDDFVFVDAKYVEGNYAEIYQGDTTMSGDRNINMGSGNYNERIEGDYIQGDKVNSMTNNPGGFSVGGSVGGNVNNVQGDGNRAVQGDNNQAVLGDSNQVIQQNQVGADTGESLTKEDVVKLLVELETLIQGAELPVNTKEEVIEDLNATKKATDKEEPNKQRALERLSSVAETLDKTSKGVEAGQKIWTTAKPIIVKVATWLGAAAGSHLLGL